METQAKLVIIGAGIVGCSVAYHLSKLGWKDIVVIDQGKRPYYGGSTSHAPGGMFQTNPSKVMTELAHYGVHMYESLEYNGEKGAHLVGGLELARIPERMNELHRRCSLGRSWGLEGEILSPAECKEKLPLLNEKEIIGGYFVADDGVGNSVVCSQAFAQYAIDSGSTVFYQQVEVQDIQIKHSQVEAVVTNKGTIKCEMILCCAGFWGPIIGNMVGQAIPLMPMEHQYAYTNDLPELSSYTKELDVPLIRSQDDALYFRQHFTKWGIGSYEHIPLSVDPYKILSPEKSPVMPSIVEWQDEHFQEAWQRSQELFPALQSPNVKLESKIHGIFSFTQDGGSLIGESLKVKNFWVAEAVWYTHAAGFGKVTAEWMDAGEPQQDIHEADINRFYAHNLGKKYVCSMGSEQYRVVYNINHPQRQMVSSRGIARSPFYDRELQLKAHFFQTFGYERPQYYESNLNRMTHTFSKRQPWAEKNWNPAEAIEAHATRNNVALYDISAFQIFEFSGSGALEFLQMQVCSNLDVPVGKISYTNVMTETGGIKSDVTITRMDENIFWMVAGVGSAPYDYANLKKRLNNRSDVQLYNISDIYTPIGIWGPKACSVVAEIADIEVDIKKFRFFRQKSAYLNTIPVHLFRLSYVGESGWEIYVRNQHALALWDMLYEIGQKYGLVVAGLGAFDSLRIEKAYRSWGVDMAQNENPFEAGIEFIIDWKKEKFIGKEALEKVKKEGTKIRLYTFRTYNKSQDLLGSETVYDKHHRRIGYVTSTNYGYSIDERIGFAYLPVEYGEEDTEIYIDYLGKMCRAFVCQDVLYDPQYKKIRL